MKEYDEMANRIIQAYIPQFLKVRNGLDELYANVLFGEEE